MDMNDNFVMTNSILQYLDHIRRYVRDSQQNRPDDSIEVCSIEQNMDDQPYRDIEFGREQNNHPTDNKPSNSHPIDTFDRQFKIDDDEELIQFNPKIEEDKYGIEAQNSDVIESLSDNKKVSKSSSSGLGDRSGGTSRSKSDAENSKNKDLKRIYKTAPKKSTNKERVKKARQRKKKYYEDLEARVMKLEKENANLILQIEKLKSQSPSEPQKVLLSKYDHKADVLKAIDETIEMIKKLPDEQKLVEKVKFFDDKYSPYGEAQVKIIDKCFNDILENMTSTMCKAMLYSIDKDGLPKTKEEFDKFKVMKKFEKHEKYPDPTVRTYLEMKHMQNLSKHQIINEINNVYPAIKEIKSELTEGLSKLFEAREQILLALMKFDLFKKNLIPKVFRKEQLIGMLEHMKVVSITVSNEKVFGIKRDYKSYEQTLNIPDPKILSKVDSKVKECSALESSLPKDTICGTFKMTCFSLSEAI